MYRDKKIWGQNETAQTGWSLEEQIWDVALIV